MIYSFLILSNTRICKDGQVDLFETLPTEYQSSAPFSLASQRSRRRKGFTELGWYRTTPFSSSILLPLLVPSLLLTFDIPCSSDYPHDSVPRDLLLISIDVSTNPFP